MDQQFDAVVHIDETSALEPLDASRAWIDIEAPATFPSGLQCKAHRPFQAGTMDGQDRKFVAMSRSC